MGLATLGGGYVMGKTLGEIAYEEYVKGAYSRMPDWDMLPPDQKDRWYRVADSILPGRMHETVDPAIVLAKRIKAVVNELGQDTSANLAFSIIQAADKVIT